MATSSVAAPTVSTTALVATSWSIAIVVALVATAAAATAPETALPVVKAFLRGRPGLAALLVVLLQETFSLIALQLREGHVLQEVANLRESKVGLESDRVDGEGGRGWGGGRRGFHPLKVGWEEREREKRGVGRWVCSEDQSSHTTRGQKKKHYHYHTEALETSLRDQMQIDGSLWQCIRNKHHPQGKVKEKFV